MWAAFAIVLALLVGTAVVTAGDEPGAPARVASAPVATVAARVEALRGVRFRERVSPQRVSPAQARREGLADLDRAHPPARRRADEELYKLLGLLPPETDLRDLSGSVFGEQVAGYYDPRDGRLRIVEGAATQNRVLDEMVVAHELTHALEDQVFGLDTETIEEGGDAALALQALVEGTATQVMYEYVGRHFPGDVALGGLLSSSLSASATTPLPPFVMEQLLFAYTDGQAFVRALHDAAGDSWRLVDAALRARPPASTEQVLHPDAYLRFEAPERVPLALRLRRGWRRVTSGRFGEWQTRAFLRTGGGLRDDEAAGWAGDRYELWQRGSCPAPCVAEDVLLMRWRWDTARDAAEFLPALRDAIAEGLAGKPAGRDRWTSRGGGVAVARAGREVELVLAPSPVEAARLAR